MGPIVSSVTRAIDQNCDDSWDYYLTEEQDGDMYMGFSIDAFHVFNREYSDNKVMVSKTMESYYSD